MLKPTAFVSLSLCLFLSFTHGQVQNNQLFRRFEYKHSFRAPNLAQRDGSIPFWIVTGDAIASSEQLRLAPSMRSRKGIAWNKRPFSESENFEIDFALKVTGQRIGADGIALWYTAQQGTLGPVYGANDYWTGMALFFDSFDNDGGRNNPYVSVMINDGTRSYNHQTDGANQVLAGCQKDFRNKPYPVRARIQYLNNVLTVEISDGLTPQPRYESCIRAENVFLPQKGYFGASAATGGLADDHDVVDFSVYSLSTQAQRAANANTIPQDERQKYDQEFEKQMLEFEEERKKFKQQHPEKAKDDDEDDPGRYYEDQQARELRLIHESQSQIYQILQQMELKLSSIQQQSGAVQPGGGQQQAVPGGGAFQQHEKNEVIQSLRDLTASIRDMKNYVNEIFTRSYNIEQKLSGGANAPVASASAGASFDPQLKNYLEGIQNDIRQVRSSQLANSGGGGAAVCPDSSCTSTTIFMLIIVIQTAAILGFVFIRSKSDKAKFY